MSNYEQPNPPQAPPPQRHHHQPRPQRGYKVRALTRRAGRAVELFGNHPNLQPVEGDCRDPASLAKAVEGVDAVACCTGTTAFPSKRWVWGGLSIHWVGLVDLRML